MNVYFRRFIDLEKPIIMKVALLHGSVTGSDVPVQGECKAKNYRPFHLRLDTVRIDIGAAIYNTVNSVNTHLTILH